MGSSKKKVSTAKATGKKPAARNTVAPKVTGPASYFPSIEKTYGKPVAHWFKLLDKVPALKHGEQVTYLKSEHGLGHGHANALVAYHRKN